LRGNVLSKSLLSPDNSKISLRIFIAPTLFCAAADNNTGIASNLPKSNCAPPSAAKVPPEKGLGKPLG